MGDHALVLARGHQGGLVDQVGEVGAREAGGAAGQGLDVDVGRQRHVAHVHAQNLFAATDVRVRHHHLTVETARTQQGRVEHVGPVGGGHQDDALVGLEAVHLDQQLVQGLLALVVAAAEAGAAMAADGVDFVDEDDAGGVLLGLLEHVAYAAGADADEHLDEVRTGDGEERHARLAGDGASQQGLTRAGRADQQRALGDLAAQLLELARVLQEIDDLLQLVLGLVDAGDVLEGDAVLVLGQQPGLGLAEAHGPPRAALHLAHEEDPHADQQQDRQGLQEQAERGDAGRALDLDVGVLGLQPLDQVVLDRRGDGGVGLAVDVAHLDHVAVDHGALHMAGVDLVQQLRVGDLAAGAAFDALVHHAVEPDEHHDDDAPDGQVTQVHRIRLLSLAAPPGGAGCEEPRPKGASTDLSDTT